MSTLPSLQKRLRIKTFQNMDEYIKTVTNWFNTNKQTKNSILWQILSIKLYPGWSNNRCESPESKSIILPSYYWEGLHLWSTPSLLISQQGLCKKLHTQFSITAFSLLIFVLHISLQENSDKVRSLILCIKVHNT